LILPEKGVYKKIKGHTDVVTCLAFSPDGHLVSGSGDNSIRIWDLKSGNSTILGEHYDGIESLSFLQDGRLVSTSLDTTFRIWNTETGNQKSFLQTL